MFSCEKKDMFCVVCGEYVPLKNRKSFSDLSKSRYSECFGISCKSLNNSWTPNIICNSCRIFLSQWKTRDYNVKRFSSPMIWREPSNHKTDCYFCSFETLGLTNKSKHSDSVQYPSVQSVTFPVVNKEKAQNSKHFESVITDRQESTDTEKMTDELTIETDNSEIKKGFFTQDELNDLVRDLGLSKESSELLASRLKEKGCLASKTKVTFYRDRDLSFRKFFTKEEDLVYCNNVEGLVNEIGSITYVASGWRLFIDSSVRSLKAVLLHNGNTYASIPVAHSINLKEEYVNLDLVLKKLMYDDHKWKLCGDLKIMTIF